MHPRTLDRRQASRGGVLQSGQQLMKYWCSMRVTSFRQIASGLGGKPRTEFSRNAVLHVRIVMTSSRCARGPIARLSRTAPDRRKARRRPQRSATSCGHTKRTQAHKEFFDEEVSSCLETMAKLGNQTLHLQKPRASLSSLGTLRSARPA